MIDIPYWRLSAFYFGYFAVIGGLSPYWAAYLSDLGFPSHTVGLLAAIPMLTRLIAPYFWGQLADRSGRRLMVIRFGAICSLLAFSGIFVSKDFWWLFAVTTAFSFFWNAILPQFENLTLFYLGKQSNTYSRVRLWGSVGFIVMVLSLGALFDGLSIRWLPTCMLLGFIWVGLLTFTLPNRSESKPVGQGNIFSIFKKRTVIAFFSAVFLLQVSHGVYYGFYTIYLQENGYSKLNISVLWAVGVVAEIVLFICIPKIFERVSLRCCFLASLLVASLRWATIGWFVDYWLALMIAQLGHAFTFGMIHVVAMAIIKRYFDNNTQGRGQALYSAVGFGAGAGVGIYAAGWIWWLGGIWAFIFAACMAGMALGVAYWGLPRTLCEANRAAG